MNNKFSLALFRVSYVFHAWKNGPEDPRASQPPISLPKASLPLRHPTLLPFPFNSPPPPPPRPSSSPNNSNPP